MYQVFPAPGSSKGLGRGGSRPGALPSRRAQASPSDLRRRANPASGAHPGGLSGPSASSVRPAPHLPPPAPVWPRDGGTDGGGDWAAPRRVPKPWESARRGECLRGAGAAWAGAAFVCGRAWTARAQASGAWSWELGGPYPQGTGSLIHGHRSGSRARRSWDHPCLAAPSLGAETRWDLWDLMTPKSGTCRTQNGAGDRLFRPWVWSRDAGR